MFGIHCGVRDERREQRGEGKGIALSHFSLSLRPNGEGPFLLSLPPSQRTQTSEIGGERHQKCNRRDGGGVAVRDCKTLEKGCLPSKIEHPISSMVFYHNL